MEHTLHFQLTSVQFIHWLFVANKHKPPLFYVITGEKSSEASQREEVYLFVSLAHFGLQVVPLFIHFVDEGMQLFAGFLKRHRQTWCLLTEHNPSPMDITFQLLIFLIVSC